MKFLFCFGIVTISLAIGDCLQCYNCYEGDYSNDHQIHNKVHEYGTYTPNIKCIFTNGQITGPTCQTSSVCVDLHAKIDKSKATYHFCSIYNEINVKNFMNVTNHNVVEITSKTCSENLCNFGNSLGNGASSIFTINLLAITIVLSLFFSS
ncbi:uncharacterized protein LOC122510474 [Leptopilina heterotoma]|uniref:uncharacterized protein LOC122510474 n=1 Tax=Leptopilina heterotoma TaxID=63436 RepID=UPI001CA8656A|nr:uncharacterized protein LOC122510474 [Leptopilina heterotoma]